MKKARVALLTCATYDRDHLRQKILEGLAQIGFDTGILEGRRVAVKPNLLNASLPEKAIVTHPEIFRAVVRIVKEHGGRPVLVESPAFEPLKKVLRKTGYERVVQEEGCEVADTGEATLVSRDNGGKYRRFEVAKAFADADVVINIPKLKTHSLTHLTGAVKNLFGMIHGLEKGKWHLRARTKAEFAEFLLDFYDALIHGFERPKHFVHLMDAVVGMEGDGPGASGDAREIGALLVGEDAVAVDSIAAHLVGLNVENIRTIIHGGRRELGRATLQDIEIRGSGLEAFDIEDFKPPQSSLMLDLAQWPLTLNVIRDLCLEKPVAKAEMCDLCYHCRKICPVGAIEKTSGNSGVPDYNYKACIRCYCCMEICPKGAISLRRGKLQWVLEWAGRR
jgi:uncharacterized protein (DUF362 family)